VSRGQDLSGLFVAGSWVRVPQHGGGRAVRLGAEKWQQRVTRRRGESVCGAASRSTRTEQGKMMLPVGYYFRVGIVN